METQKTWYDPGAGHKDYLMIILQIVGRPWRHYNLFLGCGVFKVAFGIH